MLHDENGVSKIPQVFKRAQQPRIVARVQSDARLIEHVQHAAQSRTDLRGQPNALRFAAGKCSGRTLQAEIAQPHRKEKINAFGNFLQRPRRNFFLPLAQLPKDFVHRGPRRAQR